MSSIRVEPYAGGAEEWDRFVRAQPGWTHFHLFGWQGVIRSVYGHECPYLAARDAAGTLVGVLPLVRVRSRLFGHFLVSMPFVNYGGPLGTPEAIAALLDAVEARAAGAKVGLLQLRARGELATGLDVSHGKLTVLVDLPPGDPNALWEGLPRKMRNKVRKPQGEGVSVTFGREQLAPFYDIFSRSMRDLGTPVQPRRFFEALRDAFGESVWFACAYQNGKPVAGGCAFVWGEEMEITWSAAPREYANLRPGYLLHWSFLERAAIEGCRIGNFGRSTPDSGTHEYKKQWGGRDEQLWWYYRSRSADASTPAPTDAKYAWGPRLWKRLPLPVANWLGPQLVGYIP